jgi:HAD superfamily hydrolase (TIGR01493 family)
VLRHRAVVFDLLTALLDSWSLWERVGADRQARMRYLHATARIEGYRPYEEVIAASAGPVLLERWDEVEPWPEACEALTALRDRGVLLAVATNCSVELGRRAAARVGVGFDVVVTAEEAGAYKPNPEPYRLALDRLGVDAADALFVAGSPLDLRGASSVGMDVVWHNRAGLDRGDAPAPLRELRSLLDLLSL